MLTKQDVDHLKSQVEFAMEVLLRAADERISWKMPGDSAASGAPFYAFLPGFYESASPQTTSAHLPHQDEVGTHELANVKSQPPSSPTSAVATDTADGSKTQIKLHGDNTFEYVWTMKRSGVRAMEFTVEMEGKWTKPVLNRTRRGQEDQRVILSAQRIRFHRLSNYDTENQTWKLCLRTLTRHGSDWANVGLKSTGAALPAQILSNSPACRVLAGLTKKIANKLGAPMDVMTEKWLPARGVRLAPTEGVKIKRFNPFFWYGD
ncbi:hypothetical protein GN244_ATG17815 [Phytophthora infestans]|uniref:Uncharacterized protein n=1 Tax=Phytophthora infestans TaxID=4787 RepID=A0A833WE50_PHYIN|nr:hypothetical protein GN244_ATG17815 [Phytophthora infestans]